MKSSPAIAMKVKFDHPCGSVGVIELVRDDGPFKGDPRVYVRWHFGLDVTTGEPITVLSDLQRPCTLVEITDREFAQVADNEAWPSDRKREGSSAKKRPGLTRRKPINPWNAERRARRREVTDGPQSELCRRLRCCAPKCGRRPSDPHHYPSVAAGGKDSNTVPLCRVHHDEFHDDGAATFQERWGIDLVEEARWLSLHPRVVQATGGPS